MNHKAQGKEKQAHDHTHLSSLELPLGALLIIMAQNDYDSLLILLG